MLSPHKMLQGINTGENPITVTKSHLLTGDACYAHTPRTIQKWWSIPCFCNIDRAKSALPWGLCIGALEEPVGQKARASKGEWWTVSSIQHPPHAAHPVTVPPGPSEDRAVGWTNTGLKAALIGHVCTSGCSAGIPLVWLHSGPHHQPGSTVDHHGGMTRHLLNRWKNLVYQTRIADNRNPCCKTFYKAVLFHYLAFWNVG